MSTPIIVGPIELPEIALYDPFGSNRATVRTGSALISKQVLMGMTVCVESLMAEAGSESVKLETRALITQGGAVRLDELPRDLT